VVASDGDTEGGAPISIIEMLASGMMVVSTHHCDIPGVIQHGVSGMLAGERRPEELAQHLKWLIEHPQAWPAMLDAGRKHVEQKFNARVQGLRLMAIYEDLVRFNFR
jgi:colanic acid/amylovoran biosynthesis glycosyltransferase